MNDLVFDADTHTYLLNGRIVPGVTSVLRSFVPGWNCGQWYLDRGSAVHSAVALALEDRLDWTSLDQRIVGRVKAILEFIDDVGIEADGIEVRMASERYRFAGTADLVSVGPKGRILCDWKSSISPEVEVQLGGYALLHSEERRGDISQGVAVQCNDDGTYKCKWFTKRELINGGNVFLAMLSIYNWKEKHGLNKMT